MQIISKFVSVRMEYVRLYKNNNISRSRIFSSFSFPRQRANRFYIHTIISLSSYNFEYLASYRVSHYDYDNSFLYKSVWSDNFVAGCVFFDIFSYLVTMENPVFVYIYSCFLFSVYIMLRLCAYSVSI